MRRIFWLLTPLLLLALLYGFLPRLASYSIERWLEARGLEQPHIEFDHPHWNQLQIRRLSLSQQQDGQRLVLDAGPILIEYDPLNLVGRQHLSAVRIPTVRLRIENTDTTAEATPTPLDLRPLLPAAWLVLAPADTLDIGQLELTYVPQNLPTRTLLGNINLHQGELHSRLQLFEADQAQGWFDLQLDQDNRFELSLIQDNSPFYRARGQISGSDERLHVRLDQSLELADARRWQQTLFPELLPAAQSTAADTAEVQGQINASGLISLPLQLPADPSAWRRALVLDQTLEGTVTINALNADLKQIQLPFTARLHLSDDNIQLSFPPGTQAQTKGLHLHPFSRAEVALELKSALQLQAVVTDIPASVRLASLSQSPLSLGLTSTALQHASGQLSLSPVALTISALDLQRRTAKGRAQVAKITLTSPDQAFPTVALDTDFDVKEGRVENRFRLQLDNPALTLSGRASTRLAPLSSDIHWQATPLALTRAEALWNRYYPPAPPQLSVSSGVLHHNGSINWTPRGLALRLEQHTDQLAARWGSTELAGVSWQSTTRLQRNGRLDHSGQLQAQQLNVGFPIQTLTLDYQYQHAEKETPRLHIENLAAQLLGGTVKVDSVTINPLSPTLSTTVRLQRLQLARVLELQQQEGLSGQGTLSGVLPLSFSNAGLQVRNGHIASEGPGWIRFHPDAGVAALGKSHQGMALALQALRNFEYDSLLVDLQYAPDGAALMNTRLQGKNPDWNNGRPVDFSINIEQNLLKLMQTLQFTGKLTESIEKRYR